MDADGNGLVYSGSLAYRKQNDTLSLESAAFSAGRFIATTAGIETRYFITDHLGSVRVIVNHQGEVIERNDYYPFGMRWDTGDLSDNRYRYNGKETQEFVNVPYSDYGARMLDSKYRLGWLGQDVLAEKNSSIGSYVFCANNPIRYVDPDGKDVWEFDDQGNVVSHTKTQEHDAFYMVSQVDGAWQKTGKEIIFDYGTVTGYRRPTRKVSDGKSGITTQQYTIFEMKGDNNATKLFEFMTNPGTTTNVEWTHAKVGTESSERNIVGTSHNQSSTAVGGYVLNTRYTLREVNHNHPSGVPLPSGGDMANAGNYIGKFPNVRLNIYVPSSGYSPYNGSGTLDSRITKMPNGSYILPDGRHVKIR